MQENTTKILFDAVCERHEKHEKHENPEAPVFFLDASALFLLIGLFLACDTNSVSAFAENFGAVLFSFLPERKDNDSDSEKEIAVSTVRDMAHVIGLSKKDATELILTYFGDKKGLNRRQFHIFFEMVGEKYFSLLTDAMPSLQPRSPAPMQTRDRDFDGDGHGDGDGEYFSLDAFTGPFSSQLNCEYGTYSVVCSSSRLPGIPDGYHVLDPVTHHLSRSPHSPDPVREIQVYSRSRSCCHIL